MYEPFTRKVLGPNGEVDRLEQVLDQKNLRWPPGSNPRLIPSLQDMGDALDCSPQTIKNALREAGYTQQRCHLIYKVPKEESVSDRSQ